MHAGSATLLRSVKHNKSNSQGCEFEDSAHQQNRCPWCLWDTEGFLSDREGLKLHVVTVFGRWWRGWWPLLAAPLWCELSIGLHEGISGASADAKRSEAAQVAGRPREADLGPFWRRHYTAVELSLCQPRRDLQRSYGVQIWHKGRVLHSDWTHYIYIMEEMTSYLNSEGPAGCSYLLFCRGTWGKNCLKLHSQRCCQPLRTQNLGKKKHNGLIWGIPSWTDKSVVRVKIQTFITRVVNSAFIYWLLWHLWKSKCSFQ